MWGTQAAVPRTTNSGQKVQMQTQTMSQAEIDYQDELIRERAAEIEAIAQSLEDIAIINQDLAMLVAEQSPMLDNIEANIEQATEYTATAVEELQSADRSARKRRSRLIKFYSGLAVLGAGLAFVFRRRF
ncbi:uncharacterized protein AMSG_04284 [Thecamonas trahens ATCC 50062]|uniref:t-SNARE coiled-coil homology domain-containing protein n=1 Tax=Thecamonas trahens ATCC 50062 TaxID=461836 RepID=A0A0L0D7J4_THETB|nr:hypothetical protein AMSG_04284 [Thecamonas trahens ATCC 50062]KNC48051.1 hypothetical protein AMSG_04284 [Thecamonas trahens ATCC 50062]|eukprot:XP_013759066.1 hypothetical protein AMSG_04284 [Thecamonas trahens ATCC 50062]